MRSYDAVSTRGDQSPTPQDGLLGPTLTGVADFVPPGWIAGTIRDRTHGAFPASLSSAWGEASWTARDLWSGSPGFAAARTSARLSTKMPRFDVEAVERRYRRLRRARRRGQGNPNARRRFEAGEAPTPTVAMLALGAKVASWTTTAIVIALALIVILISLQLGVFDALLR
jgi:hypothetical protein